MRKFFILCFLHVSLFANIANIQSAEELVSFFPNTLEEINKKKEELFHQFEENMEEILDTSKEQRTFNIVRLYDQSVGMIEDHIELLFTLVMVHTDKELRDFANACANDLASKKEEYILSHPEIYETFKSYAQNTKEDLSENERYYLDETLSALELLGLALSEEKRSHLIALNHELNILCSNFSKNIMDDHRSMQVNKEDLVGLDQDYLSQLQKENNTYVLYTDYPTVFPLLSYCKNPQTRKEMYQLFYNRGCPENIAILEQIIQLRDQIAKELGFESFAHLQLHSQMIKTPENAQKFIDELFDFSQKKENEEFSALLADPPEGAVLHESGKLYPSDTSYFWDHYKKENIHIDPQYVSEYFPLDTCLDGFIQIFEKFFDLQISRREISLGWSDHLILLEIKDHQSTLGFIVLDLFPRVMKYGHACMCPLIPAWKDYPALNIIIANFPKPTKDKPSLLTLENVRTLFHELGHGFHNVLGRSDMVLTCGTGVKRDFVELPSQLMEEWIWEADVLKSISSHYQTYEPLDDEMIEKIISSRNCSSGYWLQRQIFFSILSLKYFLEGDVKDTDALLKEIYEMVRPNLAFLEDCHIQASFGHLTGYGAGYYGYLYTKVMALDFFEKIKEEGIFNPEAGKKYLKAILSQGGKKDPNEMIQDYLGREVSKDPFLHRLGFKSN